MILIWLERFEKPDFNEPWAVFGNDGLLFWATWLSRKMVEVLHGVISWTDIGFCMRILFRALFKLLYGIHVLCASGK